MCCRHGSGLFGRFLQIRLVGLPGRLDRAGEVRTVVHRERLAGNIALEQTALFQLNAARIDHALDGPLEQDGFAADVADDAAGAVYQQRLAGDISLNTPLDHQIALAVDVSVDDEVLPYLSPIHPCSVDPTSWFPTFEACFSAYYVASIAVPEAV